MQLQQRTVHVTAMFGLVLGLLGAGARDARAAILNFDGLDSACDATHEASTGVPPGYAGFNLRAYSSAFQPAAYAGVECDANYQAAPLSNTYGSPSGNYAAYNPYGFGEMDLSAAYGTFTFSSASFTSFAGADDFDVFSAYSLALIGYRPGDDIDHPTYNTAIDLSATQYTAFMANWTGLNLLVMLTGALPYQDMQSNFLSFGQDGFSFLVDDINITDAQVPEPASLLLLGTGLAAAMGVVRRRRARAARV